MNVKVQITPNTNGGVGFLSPATLGLATDFHRRLMASNAPLGGGDPGTGWYEVIEVELERETLVSAYEADIWYSQSGREAFPSLPEDWERSLAIAAVAAMGY